PGRSWPASFAMALAESAGNSFAWTRPGLRTRAVRQIIQFWCSQGRGKPAGGRGVGSGIMMRKFEYRTRYKPNQPDQATAGRTNVLTPGAPRSKKPRGGHSAGCFQGLGWATFRPRINGQPFLPLPLPELPRPLPFPWEPELEPELELSEPLPVAEWSRWSCGTRTTRLVVELLPEVSVHSTTIV